MPILFFSEGVSFQLPKPRSTRLWIVKALKKEKKSLDSLTYVFCQDKFLLRLNKQYLNHNTLTDVISFDYSDRRNAINGEIYISLKRVRENSVKFKEPFDRELHRVLIHGMLHLAGYEDKTVAGKALMREKEEAYLSLR